MPTLIETTGQVVQDVTAPVLGSPTPPAGPAQVAANPGSGGVAGSEAPPGQASPAPSGQAPGAPVQPSPLTDVLGTVDQLTGLVVAPAAQQPSSGQPAGAASSQPPGGGSLLGAGSLLGLQPEAGSAPPPVTPIGQVLDLALSLPVVEPLVTDVVRPVLSSPLLAPVLGPVVAGLVWVVDALPAQLGLGRVLTDLGGVLGLPVPPGGGSFALSGLGPASGSTGAASPASPRGAPTFFGQLFGGQAPGSQPGSPSPSLPANGGGGAGAAFAAGNSLVLGWAAMFVALLIVAGRRRLRAGAPRPLPRILFVSLTERPG